MWNHDLCNFYRIGWTNIYMQWYKYNLPCISSGLLIRPTFSNLFKYASFLPPSSLETQHNTTQCLLQHCYSGFLSVQNKGRINSVYLSPVLPFACFCLLVPKHGNLQIYLRGWFFCNLFSSCFLMSEDPRLRNIMFVLKIPGFLSVYHDQYVAAEEVTLLVMQKPFGPISIYLIFSILLQTWQIKMKQKRAIENKRCTPLNIICESSWQKRNFLFLPPPFNPLLPHLSLGYFLYCL